MTAPMTVEQAIAGRRSNRAFLPKPVPRELIARILKIAGHAPSGSNIQPWKVWVIDGAVKQALSREMTELYDAGKGEKREYNYYPVKWFEPFLARRRACGWGLYGVLGIGRADKDKMHAQHRRNFLFFDAPVGLVFSIHRDLEQGSWLDYGMFLQNVMLAARPFGLETCPQAAFLEFSRLLQRRLAIPADETVVCGMALGYPDLNDPVNAFSPKRIEVEEFVRFVDEVAPDEV